MQTGWNVCVHTRQPPDNKATQLQGYGELFMKRPPGQSFLHIITASAQTHRSSHLYSKYPQVTFTGYFHNQDGDLLYIYILGSTSGNDACNEVMAGLGSRQSLHRVVKTKNPTSSSQVPEMHVCKVNICSTLTNKYINCFSRLLIQIT